MTETDRMDEARLRARIVDELEEIAFSRGDKPGERMKAMELLGRICGLWKDGDRDGDDLAGELSKLGELLEQRRARRGQG